MERLLIIDTPIGKLGITASEVAITRIFFGSKYRCKRKPCNAPELCTEENATPLLRQAVNELTEYFAGKRHEFTLPLEPAGTPFQQAVWEALRTIPYGETRSYGQIAAKIGRPTASRAVGMANNRNPIAIVVPCHRVVGSTGALVGYAGGLGIKTHLLNLERDPNGLFG
ncbi:methylated-DNA--[protein]-cysteine S-methyltransferase [uncultured Alistipes sp.]|jgi:methylated-DNA--[protein]-cysteine S-methyltransferase|uniref:methylated-DNA--[protein]-cysteine S-methyltransferase n=1 Tax=uncultured Alistipes sp. TaxID=538949 RepID=UPI0025F1E1A1|nr:methylated-DNA--[protein]-cysteine S-methyltransferase [uncultured Alistipes sp.]